VGQLRTASAFGRRLFWAPRCGRKTLGLREIMIRYVICCVALFASGALAQSGSGKLTALGVWKGTSLCTIRPSGCHDETAVYRITALPGKDSVALDGRKVVNGEEVQMGVLPCLNRGASLVCVMPSATWSFTIRGDSLVGELRLADGRRSRDVRTVRSAR
jgi:hypothetical protein